MLDETGSNNPQIADFWTGAQSINTERASYYIGTKGAKNLEMSALYQRKVDVDMLYAVKSVLADVSSVSSSSEQRLRKVFALTKG